MRIKTLHAAIESSIQYLAAQQLDDGSFTCYISTDPNKFDDATSVKMTFTNALLLGSLARVANPKIQELTGSLAAFLVSQKSQNWTFNYWANDEPQKRTREYPDDLDVTFCVLVGLYLHNPGLISPEVLAAMTKVLVATESRIGGPYRTWLVTTNNDKRWLDVDIAVNTNIAYFLSLVSTPPDKLMKFLHEHIAIGEITSPYYPPLYPAAYYLSRVYRGTHVPKLAKILQENAGNLSPLDHALSAIALLNLGTPPSDVEKHITALIDSQNTDGSWNAAAFSIDHYIKGEARYCGAATLTTGFALEAIALYQKSSKNYRAATREKAKVTSVKNQVLGHITQECETLAHPSRDVVLQSVQKVAQSSNGPAIFGFANSFNESLQKPLRGADSLITRLGAANLYGWTAYTIYDDFLDEEGSLLLLPSANITMRLSYDTFLNISPDTSFSSHVRSVFHSIDNANTCEIINCRPRTHSNRSITLGHLPAYADLSPLAYRSLGHTLAPLTILAATGIKPHARDFQAINTALIHYIIAKQLNDDAHDWREDFMHGHITFVVATILRELAVTPGTYKFHELLPVMQRHFWHNTLITVCTEMKNQLGLSREALRATTILKQKNVITDLLDAINSSVEDTLSKQAQTKEFLKHF